MNDYFYNIFPSQFRTLHFSRPNRIVAEEMLHDETALFFGGRDWESVKSDLQLIPINDRPKFILSLFMVVLTDQCFYTHYKETYHTWQNKTHYPKFGWSGFGVHNENPLKILWAPEREKVISQEEIIALLPEFITFIRSEVQSYFTLNLPSVPVTAFFDAIKKDDAFQYSEGIIIPKFKEYFSNVCTVL